MNKRNTLKCKNGYYRQVYYGNSMIPLGKSTFTMTVDKFYSQLGIGLVSLSFNQYLDYINVHKDKHSWMLLSDGYLYSKSIQTKTDVKFQ